MTVSPVYRYDPTRDDDLTPRPGFTAIYGLFDPRDGELRYVGKTKRPGKRLLEHVSTADAPSRRGYPVCCWVRSLTKKDIKPALLILEWASDETWVEAEIRHIASARALGFALLNVTDGGEVGGAFKRSAETRAKMSVNAKRQYESRREDLIAAHTGKPLTPEHKAKLSIALTGRVVSQETRDKLSARQKGRKQTPEQIEKHAASLRGRKATPEQRAHISAGKFGIKHGPMPQSTRDRLSESLRGRTLTPEHRANVSKGQLGKKKPKQSDTMKRLWADPGSRASMLSKQRATRAANRLKP